MAKLWVNKIIVKILRGNFQVIIQQIEFWRLFLIVNFLHTVHIYMLKNFK
jgi:hypothetical protein